MSRVKKLSPRVLEELSAYIDGQLNASEAQKLEADCARSFQLQQALERFKATQALTRSLPQHKAPRNFILTRAEAAEAKRGRNWTRAFGLAFSLCAVMLVAIFSYEGLLTDKLKVDQNKEAAPQAVEYNLQTEDEAETPLVAQSLPEESPAESAIAEEPVLLNWGGSYGGMGGGGMGSADGAMGGITTFANEPPITEGVLLSEPAGDERSAVETTEELIPVYINPTTGQVTICETQYDCDFGGEGISDDPSDLVQYVDKQTLEKLLQKNETLSSSVASSEEPPEFGNTMPAILGIDEENQGEIIAISPVFSADEPETSNAFDKQAAEEEKSEALPEGSQDTSDIAPRELMAEAEPEMETDSSPEASAPKSPQPTTAESEPVGKYDHDSDHQNYLRDQLFLWLKIGAASLAVLFGAIWLMLRRR